MNTLVYLLLLVVTLTEVSQAIDKQCHNGTGRCYWLGTGSKTWDAARISCQSGGGDLAVMETEKLWDFVDTVFTFR